MLTILLSMTVLAGTTLAGTPTLQQRDRAANQDSFNAAASALIASYIPEKDWPVLTASFGAAATAAAVTGDVGSVIYSALQTSPRPQWFQDAIPTQYQSNLLTLESAIDEIRPAVLTVVTTTTTNSAGQVVTTTLPASIVPTTATITSTSGTVSVIRTSTGSVTVATTTTTTSSPNAAPMQTGFAQGVAAVVGLAGLALAL